MVEGQPMASPGPIPHCAPRGLPSATTRPRPAEAVGQPAAGPGMCSSLTCVLWKPSLATVFANWNQLGTWSATYLILFGIKLAPLLSNTTWIKINPSTWDMTFKQKRITAHCLSPAWLKNPDSSTPVDSCPKAALHYHYFPSIILPGKVCQPVYMTDTHIMARPSSSPVIKAEKPQRYVF